MCFSISKDIQAEPEIIIAPRIVPAPTAPRPLSIQQPQSRPRSRMSQSTPQPETLIPLECQTPRQSGTHLSPYRASQTRYEYSSSPRASQTLYLPSPPSPRASQGQVIVISKSHRSPRTSVSQVPPSPRASQSQVVYTPQAYGYGTGTLLMERQVSGGAPIITERTVSNGVIMERTVSGGRPGLSVQNVQGHRRSGSLGVERRMSAKYGGDPRASNVSYRSTRERIVVVDSSGTRREYYR